jgi:hypothetical protein
MEARANAIHAKYAEQKQVQLRLHTENLNVSSWLRLVSAQR